MVNVTPSASADYETRSVPETPFASEKRNLAFTLVGIATQLAHMGAVDDCLATLKDARSAAVRAGTPVHEAITVAAGAVERIAYRHGAIHMIQTAEGLAYLGSPVTALALDTARTYASRLDREFKANADAAIAEIEKLIAEHPAAGSQ